MKVVFQCLSIRTQRLGLRTPAPIFLFSTRLPGLYILLACFTIDELDLAISDSCLFYCLHCEGGCCVKRGALIHTDVIEAISCIPLDLI